MQSLIKHKPSLLLGRLPAASTRRRSASPPRYISTGLLTPLDEPGSECSIDTSTPSAIVTGTTGPSRPPPAHVLRVLPYLLAQLP